MNKKLYFIGGDYFTEEERDNQWNRYFMMTKYAFDEEAAKDKRLKQYEFVPVWKCDLEEFKGIWSRLSTYGIIWHSHGTEKGYPVAHHYGIEKDPWRRSDPALASARYLDPDKLQNSSPNMKFVVFLGCRLGTLRNKWTKKLPNRTIFVAWDLDLYGIQKGSLEDYTEQQKKVTIDHWIKNTQCTSPGKGYRCLLRYLAKL